MTKIYHFSIFMCDKIAFFIQLQSNVHLPPFNWVSIQKCCNYVWINVFQYPITNWFISMYIWWSKLSDVYCSNKLLLSYTYSDHGNKTPFLNKKKNLPLCLKAMWVTDISLSLCLNFNLGLIFYKPQIFSLRSGFERHPHTQPKILPWLKSLGSQKKYTLTS